MRSGRSGLQVEQLSCEYQQEALAIDAANPSLSWVLTARDRTRLRPLMRS